MIDAPSYEEDTDTYADPDEIVLTEDNAQEVMRYFNSTFV